MQWRSVDRKEGVAHVQGNASVFLICALIKTNPIGRWKESKEWSGFESVNYGVHTPRLKKTLRRDYREVGPSRVNKCHKVMSHLCKNKCGPNDTFCEFARKESVVLLVLYIIQVVCLIFAVIVLVLSFFSTYAFQEHIKSVTDNEVCSLLNLGTCGLHVVLGSLRTGVESVDWDISSLLCHMYYLFTDSPARRALFTQLTGCASFPLKFCGVRWLEYAKCFQTALQIWNHVVKFLKEAKLPKTKPVETLKRAACDPFLKCKLAFCKTIADECQPFLQRFQTSKPMTPYLFEAVEKLLRYLMNRCVKPDLMKCTGPNKNIDVGFATKRLLGETAITVTERQKLEFIHECRSMLTTMIAKLQERSPLKQKAVRGLSSLDPCVIQHSPQLGQKRFSFLLEELNHANIINDVLAENAKKEYLHFCNLKKSQLQEIFRPCDQFSDEVGLDTIYGSFLIGDANYKHLWEVIKICLVLSHGNATVEGGFSVNKSLLVENMHEKTVTAQRHIHDEIQEAGGIKNIHISKKMLDYVRGARKRYHEYLEMKKQERSEEDKKKAEKRKLDIQRSVTSSPLYSASMRTPLSIGSLGNHYRSRFPAPIGSSLFSHWTRPGSSEGYLAWWLLGKRPVSSLSQVNKFIREVKSHANDSVLKQQISPFADNLAWRNCHGRCSESGNSRTAILKPGTCWLKTADKAREALMTLTNVYGVVSLPLAPRQQTLVNELSSPMASLVLTESSQLTYDSQDLAISCELSVSTKEAMGLLWLNWCHLRHCSLSSPVVFHTLRARVSDPRASFFVAAKLGINSIRLAIPFARACPRADITRSTQQGVSLLRSHTLSYLLSPGLAVVSLLRYHVQDRRNHGNGRTEGSMKRTKPHPQQHKCLELAYPSLLRAVFLQKGGLQMKLRINSREHIIAKGYRPCYIPLNYLH
uniref:Uncharacterized protein n=1 Tax=Timema douglasi TaxID=61478 RepID=A0A7R8VQY8_TIMDO|nr:unnamed protein product [Timema douglasi]